MVEKLSGSVVKKMWRQNPLNHSTPQPLNCSSYKKNREEKFEFSSRVEVIG
jgi:hypothetical protein